MFFYKYDEVELRCILNFLLFKVKFRPLNYFLRSKFYKFFKLIDDKRFIKKINKIPKNYRIISLGTYCFPRVITTYNGLKPKREQGEKSCPFDLAFFSDFDKIIELVDTKFEHLYDNLEYRYPDGWCVDDFKCWVNTDFEAIFNHEVDFTREKFIERYNNRIKNLYDYMSEKSLHKFFVISSRNTLLSENQIKKIKEVLLKFMQEEDFDIILINQYYKVNKINLKNVYVINQYKNYESFSVLDKNHEWVKELECRTTPEAQKIYNEVTSGLIKIIDNVMKG